MYFLIDAILIALLVSVIYFGVRYGFTRHFIFGILRTVIGIAGGIGASVGVYLLMSKMGWLGWLEYISNGVRRFFGEISNPALLTDELFRQVAMIIAYLPFALIFIIAGYLLAYHLINWLVKGIFWSVFVAKKKIKAVRVIDRVLGLVINLALYAVVVFAVFGAVHAFNQNGKYANITGADASQQGAFLNRTVNNFAEPILTNLHEDMTASPLGHLIYEYNPLNDMFSGMFGN